jgi:hypothetical protein
LTVSWLDEVDEERRREQEAKRQKEEQLQLAGKHALAFALSVDQLVRENLAEVAKRTWPDGFSMHGPDHASTLQLWSAGGTHSSYRVYLRFDTRGDLTTVGVGSVFPDSSWNQWNEERSIFSEDVLRELLKIHYRRGPISWPVTEDRP